MKPQTVLILGANGRLGRAAMLAFADAGWRVLAQARRAPKSLPRGAAHVAADLGDVDALVAQAAGARAVVYAVNPPYTEWTRRMMPLARQGMTVAERLGALFMLPGNVYAFGEQMPARLDENTPERPTTLKGRQRAELEAEIAARPGLRSVVIRAGDFFGGDGTGSWFDQAVVKSLRAGKLVYPGPLDAPHAWAYLPDLAQAFVAVAARDDDRKAHRRLHFAGHTLTGRQLLAGLEDAAASLGVAPKGRWRHGGMPWGLIRALGLVVPMWRELASMAYLWRVPHALDGTALRAAVGELPATPLHEALTESLRALGYGAAPRLVTHPT
jgi:nucleoside-diphosphate-sugar epimerase